MTIEKVSQEDMLSNFKERLTAILEENKQLAEKIKGNEITALKLQGAIESSRLLYSGGRNCFQSSG